MYALLLTQCVLRQRYSKRQPTPFPAALKSPFIAFPCTAFPPPAALFDREIRLLPLSQRFYVESIVSPFGAFVKGFSKFFTFFGFRHLPENGRNSVGGIPQKPCLCADVNKMLQIFFIYFHFMGLYYFYCTACFSDSEASGSVQYDRKVVFS